MKVSKIFLILIGLLLCNPKNEIEAKSAFVTETGNEVIWLAKVEIKGSPAIIDINGNYVVSPEIYEKIDFNWFSEGLCPVKRNGKWGYVDTTGKEVIPCKWEAVGKFERGLAWVGIDYGDGYNLLRGCIDTTGKIILEPKYLYVDLVKGADLIKTEGPNCLYDLKGNLKVENVWGIRQMCKNGRLLIDKTGNYGSEYFVDDKGNRMTKNFFKANEYSGGYAYVELRDEIKGAIKGYMDTEGNIINLDGYEWLDAFKEDGYAVVSKSIGNKGVINDKFEEIVPCIYEEILSISWENRDQLFINGLIQVKKNDQYALINTNAKIVIPFGKYSRFEMNRENVLEASTFNRYEHRDKDGKIISSGKTDVIIDERGNQLSDYEYEFIGDFNGGYAAVKREGNYGIINKHGHEVVPAVYKFDDILGDGVVKEFTDLGIIRVCKDGKWGLLNKKGEIIVPFYYDNMGDFIDGISVVKVDKKYGAIDTNGKIVVPIDFYVQDFVPKFSGGRLGIRKRTNAGIKAGYIDKEGNEVIPCIYDKVHSFKKISVY